MTPIEEAAILGAGVAAGMINAAVGSGSLITFPALLACGFPPVTANISNNIGLVPGGVASIWGYRRELAGQRRRLLALGTMSVLGGVTGAVLLLTLPSSSFRLIVPVLLGVAILLVAIQPWIQRRLAVRRSLRDEVAPAEASSGFGPAAMTATGAIGVYGGYFGGAQGILLLGVLGTITTEPLQRLNALKNTLVTCVNAIAAVIFLIVAPSQVDWRIVALIALGSSLGALLGSRIGRCLPQSVLRVVIVVVGVIAIAGLLRH